MRLYTVTLFNPDETVSGRQQLRAADDDAAIDAVGETPHPYGIDVYDGERLVARFPPMGLDLNGR